jgi:hypothetical protein
MDRSTVKRKWFPLWVIPLVALGAVMTVWLRLSIVGTTYRIHQEDKKIRALRQEQGKAELQLANQRSPRRLEGLARTRFGLTQPSADRVVHLR